MILDVPSIVKKKWIILLLQLFSCGYRDAIPEVFCWTSQRRIQRKSRKYSVHEL